MGSLHAQRWKRVKVQKSGPRYQFSPTAWLVTWNRVPSQSKCRVPEPPPWLGRVLNHWWFTIREKSTCSLKIENKYWKQAGKPPASSRVVYSYVLLRYARDDSSDTVRLDFWMIYPFMIGCNYDIAVTTVYLIYTPLYDVACQYIQQMNNELKRKQKWSALRSLQDVTWFHMPKLHCSHRIPHPPTHHHDRHHPQHNQHARRGHNSQQGPLLSN